MFDILDGIDLIFGFNNIYMVTILLYNLHGLRFPDISLWRLYFVNLYYIIILKLRTYDGLY